ncbi:MAG: hypothetical protein V1735_00705 [Nanoarchaeota archaeon]
MPRGRPTKSAVRERIKAILSEVKQAYGYEVFKRYKERYGDVSMRLVYYHLKKGVALGDFKVDKVQVEQGDYSWGKSAEKVYYKLA